MKLHHIQLLFCVCVQEAGVANSQFHDDNLYTTVFNLFAAGTETTSTTLRWCLLFMAKFPQIQGKDLCSPHKHTNKLLQQQITTGTKLGFPENVIS